MQQIIQNIRTGKLSVQNVPAPCALPGQVLIANEASLVSAGTEKMIMDLAKKSLLGKAKERPDQVRRVLQKIRSEGLASTFQAVQAKLDEPMTMGYSSAGKVLACGAGVQHFKPGDRVASNGPHAEVVSVPVNLCAQVPDGVTAEEASFAVLGSIAMQGFRLSKCSVGETVLVIGLGLIGQLTVAIAKAGGCRVIGTDLEPAKCDLAKQMGADLALPDFSADVLDSLTGGLGADAVIITASTKSNGPIELAAECVRQKGRVVLVGVVGLNIDRRPFYFKEAEFVVSCSYGPGRYDAEYEQRGHDYPAGYVRWTEQRNIQSVIELIASGAIKVGPLISHRFAIADAAAAYQLIEEGAEPYMGVVLTYDQSALDSVASSIRLKPAQAGGDAASERQIRYGMLGAGNFARTVLLPAIAKCPEFAPVAICTAKGVSGTQTGGQMGFEISTTDENVIFDDPSISTVFCLTRHDRHADQVSKAIRAGKNIFVEKPLCLSIDELMQIEKVLTETASPPLVMVGFNRRFSPAARRVRDFFRGTTAPLTVSIRINAGAIPPDHWTQDELEGGGRIIGEACHGIDLATYLTGSLPTRVFAESIRDPASSAISDDQCFITLRHASGSVSNIAYLAGGDRAIGKERVEVFGGGLVGIIDDFRSTTTCRSGSAKTSKGRMNKGHHEEIRQLAGALTGAPADLIGWSEIRSVTLASILAVQSLREGIPLEIPF